MGEARNIIFEVVFPNRLIMIYDKRSLRVKITRNQQISIKVLNSRPCHLAFCVRKQAIASYSGS